MNYFFRRRIIWLQLCSQMTIKRFRSDSFTRINNEVKRRPEAVKFSENFKTSGVEGFPVITNTETHHLARVISTEHVFEEEKTGSKILKLVAQKLKNSTSTENDGPLLKIYLKDIWNCSPVRVDTLIRIIEPLKISENTYEISMANGLLIVEPETVISSTTMSQLSWCKRKALFNERLRGYGANFAMLLGTVAHELFQTAIICDPKIVNSTFLLKEFRENLFPEICLDMVVLDISPIKFEADLTPYIVNICKWICEFSPITKDVENFKPLSKKSSICFDKLEDIEDNIWTPTIGVKGRIDLSFRSRNKFTQVDDILALELKSGKSYANQQSVEHQAQVLLYSLMLSERSNSGRIAPGFVLYLKDNFLQLITPKAIDLKGVLHMRNDVAPNFARFDLDAFPEPLSTPRLCGYCDYKLQCSLVDRFNSTIPTSSNNQKIPITSEPFSKYDLSVDMKDFFDKNLSHLKSDHVEYARKWMQWIFAEWRRAKACGADGRLFRELPEQRQNHGSCLSQMKITSCIKKISSRNSSLVTFVKNDGSTITNCPFTNGEFIIISTTNSYAVLMGNISSQNDREIVVSCDKALPESLTKSNANNIFHLDKHDSFSIYQLMLTNITSLMMDSPFAAKARSLIIDKKLPTVRKITKSEVDLIKPLLKAIRNDMQSRAVVKSLICQDYLLIETAPGEAKTNTIVSIVRCLKKLGKRVLLTAFSGNSLEAILLELSKHINENELLKVGSTKPENFEKLSKFLLEKKLAKIFENEKVTVRQFNKIRTILFDTPIVASTCLTVSNHAVFAKTNFDVCIIDDGSMAIQAAILSPILQAESFILIGDSNRQPIVLDSISKKLGMGISLMEHLRQIQTNSFVNLNSQIKQRKSRSSIETDVGAEGGAGGGGRS